MAICPHCNKEIPDDVAICPYCGAQVSPDVAICGSCGKVIPADAKVCPYCGVELADVAKCPRCGHEIPQDAKSCPNCGYRFDKDAQFLDINYENSDSAGASGRAYRIKYVMEKKKKSRSSANSEILSSAPHHALIAMVLSLIILAVGLWFVITGWQLIVTVKSFEGANTFLNSVKFSYGALLAAQFILLFVGFIFAIKYMAIQENEFVGAFIYLFIYMMYSASQGYEVILERAYYASQANMGGSATSAAYAVYLNLIYVMLIIGIMATFVSAHVSKSRRY